MGIFTINNYYKIQIHASTFLLFVFWAGWGFCLFALVLLVLISLQFPIHFVSSSNFWLGDGTFFFSTFILYK